MIPLKTNIKQKKTEKVHNLGKSVLHTVVAYQMQLNNILGNILCNILYSPLVFIESLCYDTCICCISMIDETELTNILLRNTPMAVSKVT